MKRLILVAEVGAGKTILLQEKAKRLLEQNKQVVVVITGAEYDNFKGESLLATQYRQMLRRAEQKQQKTLKEHDQIPQLQGGTRKKQRKSNMKSKTIQEQQDKHYEESHGEVNSTDELIQVKEVTGKGDFLHYRCFPATVAS